MLETVLTRIILRYAQRFWAHFQGSPLGLMHTLASQLRKITMFSSLLIVFISKSVLTKWIKCTVSSIRSICTPVEFHSAWTLEEHAHCTRHGPSQKRTGKPQCTVKDLAEYIGIYWDAWCIYACFLRVYCVYRVFFVSYVH